MRRWVEWRESGFHCSSLSLSQCCMLRMHMQIKKCILHTCTLHSTWSKFNSISQCSFFVLNGHQVNVIKIKLFTFMQLLFAKRSTYSRTPTSVPSRRDFSKRVTKPTRLPNPLFFGYKERVYCTVLERRERERKRRERDLQFWLEWDEWNGILLSVDPIAHLSLSLSMLHTLDANDKWQKNAFCILASTSLCMVKLYFFQSMQFLCVMDATRLVFLLCHVCGRMKKKKTFAKTHAHILFVCAWSS